MADIHDEIVYAFIANIPPIYHSSDLRNYFSQFLESAGFECFHFRHRPETIKSLNDDKQISKVGSEIDRTQPHDSATRVAKKKNERTTCCVVKLKHSKLNQLMKMYNRKHWLDRKGDSVKSLCCISKVKVFDVTSAEATLQQRFKTRGQMKEIAHDRETMTRADLLGLPELHPPALMPNGNVGTPTKYFLKQIQLCKLPPGVIKKLGLVFPRMRTNRRYGCVPLEYENKDKQICGHEEDERSLNARENSDPDVEVVSGRGHDIFSENCTLPKDYNAEQTEINDNVNNPDDSASDADECEEWERYEAIHDDPANKERNEERLYETEMEIVWEKGGPGIVWYTDAAFWDEQEGDAEEKDVDDWDIDTSAYYDTEAGDRDARDFIKMRRETRLRHGKDNGDDSSSSATIGAFERHTKGIGRRLLTSQGWREGQGLGSSIKGITDALDNDGQLPSDKRGFGYHGEKLAVFGGPVTYTAKRVKHDDDRIRITTIYDDPTKEDPDDVLLRRTHHNRLKHRSSTGSVPESHSNAHPYFKYRDGVQFLKSAETLNPPTENDTKPST